MFAFVHKHTQQQTHRHTQTHTDTHARSTGGPASPSLAYLEGPDKGVFSTHHVWASLLKKQRLREPIVRFASQTAKDWKLTERCMHALTRYACKLELHMHVSLGPRTITFHSRWVYPEFIPIIHICPEKTSDPFIGLLNEPELYQSPGRRHIEVPPAKDCQLYGGR